MRDHALYPGRILPVGKSDSESTSREHWPGCSFRILFRIFSCNLAEMLDMFLTEIEP
jgi:hypothetical protein